MDSQIQSTTNSSWQILANLSRQQAGNSNDCVELDWNKTLEVLANSSSKLGGTRSWLWQTCTEFGFYQTCKEHSRCPYGKGYHNINSDLEICRFAYGISKEEVYESVRQSLEYYGDHMELKGASRILSVNGDVDPWSTLARTHITLSHEDQKEEDLLPVYIVKGASHHFWTHPVKAADDEDMRSAREFIYTTIMKWLDLVKVGDKEVGASTGALE